MDIEISVERLRQGLVDHYGTAMAGGQWPAIADVSEVEDASPEELIEIAEREGIDLRKCEWVSKNSGAGRDSPLHEGCPPLAGWVG